MPAITQPLKWHGGKHYLASKIIASMPPHLHYVEPYFGGGAVLFARDPSQDWYEGASDYDGSAKMRGCSEVVSDINGWLTNFWDCLKDPVSFEIMRRTLSVTPFSEVEFARALDEAGADYVGMFDVAAAISFFVRYRQSRQGLGKDFATLSRTRTRRGMNEQASAWLSAVEGLPEAHERLKDVVILNHDALDVIRQQDGEKTLFYCDAPYVHSTRSTVKEYGQYEMSEFAHACLLAVLAVPEAKPDFGKPWTAAQWETLAVLYHQPLKGKFILSGYRSKLYDDMASAQGWRRVEFELPNNAGGGKTKRRMTECVWMNFEPVGETE